MIVRMRATSVAWLVAFVCVLIASVTPDITGGLRHTAAAAALPATATADAGLPLSSVTAGTATAPPASPTAAPSTPAASTTPAATDAPVIPVPSFAPSTTPVPVLPNPTSPVTPTTDSAVPALGGGTQNAVPLEFDANDGQSDPSVAFLAHAGASTVFFTPQEADLALPVPALTATAGLTDPVTTTGVLSATMVRVGFASAPVTVAGTEPTTATANYLSGSDPSAWHTGLATYGGLTYQGVAPGIDLVVSGTIAGQLEATYHVAPGANPSGIALTLGGGASASLDSTGNLVLQTPAGPVTLSAPVAYQTINGQQVHVDVSYALAPSGPASPTSPAASPTAPDTATTAPTTTIPAAPAVSATASATPTLPVTTTLGLVVGTYDPTQPLTIDPVLSWSAYVSGSQNERAHGVALDQQGNIYLTGNTLSADFPVSSGAYSTTFAGGNGDAYVVKLSPDGTTRLYSSYLGGSAADQGNAIAVDSGGHAYVAGETWSADFPTTPNAAQTTFGGLDDAFLSELSPDGTSLVYSTYLGGTGYDAGYALALGQQHLVYVAGRNGLGGLPTTSNAYQASYQGGDASQPSDGFIMAVDTSASGASGLVYASYFGGAGNEQINGLGADAHGNVYVTGATDSTNVPISTTLPYTSYQGGSNDAFVAKLHITSSSAGLIFSTYLGGSGDDQGHAIAVDDSGAFVTGQTTSANFPVYNAAQSTYGGGTSDAFVTRINDTETALAYSSYLGGSGDDYGYGITAGGPGGVNVVGLTYSTDFITTTDALQPARSWSFSGFITQFNTQYGGSASLLYSSYLGGTTGDSEALAVATDGQNNAVVAGFTRSTDLQGTGGTVQPTPVPNGGEDAFVSKLEATPDCPNGLDCADIGDPVLSGDQILSGSRANGTWYVQDASSGTDTGSTSDQFHYVAMDALGDGSISARIVTQTNSSSSAKAGIMYRLSEDPAAPYYSVVAQPYNGAGSLLVQYRSTVGGTVTLRTSASVTLPTYVRATRSGTIFTAYTSTDGLQWSALTNSTQQVDALTNTIQAGFMAAASNTALTTTATLDHVTINTCPTGWKCDDLGSPATAGDQAPLGDQFVNGPSPFFIVRGAGTGINSGATADQFHYMHTTFGSSGSASARITDLRTADGSAEDPAAAAGVMLRQTTDPSAPYYFVGMTAGNGLVVQDRTITGTAATTLVQTVGITTPLYLRADRIGTSFLAYTSTDNITWAPLSGSGVSISGMSGDIEQGLATTSHQTAVATAGTFDYVRMDACPDTWTCADLSGATPQGSQNLSNGVWSLRGTVQSRYVWQNITGDGGLSARIASLGATRPNATASLLYASQGTGQVPYYIAGMTPNYGLVIQTRTTTGGAITYPAISSTATLPLYLDVVRVGNTFTTYTSPDDMTWTAVPNSSVTISGMSDTADLGLDVNSADANAWTTATFDTLDITGTTDTVPPAGTDLTNLDTHTEQYTQGANGLVDLHLYNSPIGIPVPAQWQRRDTTLITSTTVLTPANLPFTETLAADTTGLSTGTGAAPTMSMLTSEDGITLGVALGATAPYAVGTVQSNAVTYTAAMSSIRTPAPPASDLSLRSTSSGLDARVVLHSASEAGPFVLNLSGDATMQLTQDTSGAIQVTEPVTTYDATGVASGTVTRTEYTVQPPILVDSSAAVTTPISTGPATATLSGPNTVTLNVDPSWLNDPSRHFPATLDLPLVTTYSSDHTGIWGTVNSCAPTLPAPRTKVVVGAFNACIYHGQAYFDTTTLPLNTPVVSATLYLYTPNQMTTTGVQVYSNTASDSFDPTILPSWSSAPSAGTTGVAQSGSDGHWQSWDVTSIVQGWVNDNTSNAGLTLVGNGAPVTFESALGAASGGPSVAPYLDITYDPQPQRRKQSYYDGASSIYGISGSFIVHSYNKVCDPGTKSTCNGLTPPFQVASHLKGAFIRVSVTVPCNEPNPGSGYWDNTQTNYGRTGTPGMNGGQGSIVEVMKDAYHNGLIPIVTFQLPNPDPKNPQPDCRNLYSPQKAPAAYQDNWQALMDDFVSSFPSGWLGAQGFPTHTYFEIGNEQNLNDPAYYGPGKVGNYPSLFAAAAKALFNALGGTAAQTSGTYQSKYTILTTGVTNPAVNKHSLDPSPNVRDPVTGVNKDSNNYYVTTTALGQAEQTVQGASGAAGLPGVDPWRLGLAVHPYHYSTYAYPVGPPSYWGNYYTEYGITVNQHGRLSILRNGWVPPNDLESMIDLWTHLTNTHQKQFPVPVIFTEDNWSSEPAVQKDAGNAQFCSDSTGCEGNYLADLFTWLYRHKLAVSGASQTGYVPIRVGWYRGSDLDFPLGLYYSDGSPKRFLVRQCMGMRSNASTDNTVIDPNVGFVNAAMPNYYNMLRYSTCY